MKFKEWDGFVNGDWQSEIDVRDFIQKNYTPYTGDDSFLSEATNTTKKLWDEVLALYKKETENGGVLDISNDITSLVFVAGLEMSNPYFSAIIFKSFNALI